MFDVLKSVENGLNFNSSKSTMEILEHVGNKAKGRISKRVFQENKARQIFRKTNISYPLIRTRTCAYQGVRNVRFSENLASFVFLKDPFWDSPFCLITDEQCVYPMEILEQCVYLLKVNKDTRMSLTSIWYSYCDF